MTPSEVLRSETSKARREKLEAVMDLQFRAVGMKPERQFRFHEVRKWRFDFAFVDAKVAIEVDGATFSRGRHVRGEGYAEDCRKRAEAMLLGWRVLNATGDQVKSGEALRWVEGLLKLLEA